MESNWGSKSHWESHHESPPSRHERKGKPGHPTMGALSTSLAAHFAHWVWNPGVKKPELLVAKTWRDFEARETWWFWMVLGVWGRKSVVFQWVSPCFTLFHLFKVIQFTVAGWSRGIAAPTTSAGLEQGPPPTIH